MKRLLQNKKHLLVLLFAMLMNAFGMRANPVDMNAACEVGMKFMNANTNTLLRGVDELQLVTTYNISRGDVAFYIFNTPNGFVIVSADDCATPILGYSNEGQFDENNIPIQLQDILQGFVEQIQYGIENQLEADEQTAQQWELVRTIGRLTNNRSDEIVEPLLTTTWNQGYPYNMYVPNSYPTGCVATAMAQIMKYWEWPVQGTGEHSYQWNGQTLSANFGETTYDWDNMLDSYGNSTQEQKEAVATLMWHCGVSINMNYASGGSGAYLYPSSLIDYFNYSDDLHEEYRHDDESWMSLLKTDLDLGRPVYYVGYDGNQAHALVCDGYDVNDRFHFNYGWGGSSNGYFALNAIQYSRSNYGIFNIHPNASITRQVTASASPSDGGIVAGAGMYDIGSICTLTATANGGYIFMYWTEDDEVVSSQAEYSFCVRKDRDLVAHFGTPFPIEVVIDPEGGGMVSGVGEYAYGNTCTLTATANEGYDFIGWRRANGSVASTASSYSFTVTEATTLTAVFAVSDGEQIPFADLNVKALCVANWDTNGDGELSYSEAAAVTDLGLVFRNNSTITSFEELRYFIGLTTIGNNAFEGCRNLSGSLCIPNSVTTIGDYAFYYCTGLTGTLTIPNSVTEIGHAAFYHCVGFTSSLTLGTSLTTIGSQAFDGCSGFTGNLTIGDSVTTIGNYAFRGCSGFTGNLTIGNSVTTIGEYAFRECSGFTGSLTIPNSVTTIGGGAFYNCIGFTGNLTIGNSVVSIGGSAFWKCSGFTGDLNIPDSVTTIGYYAFENCSGFTGNLTIGNSVTTIGGRAFVGCNGFTGSLTLGNSLTTIGNAAFSGCRGFTGNLIIPNSVITIGNYAFQGCTGFTGSLTIPDSVTTIGYYAFDGCSGFNGNLIIGDAVITIGNNAFRNCSGFTGGLTIGNSVALIDSWAFAWTSFTGSLIIGNAVTTIGDYAFYSCSGLSSVTIGNSVISIGDNAFIGCGIISLFVLAETPPVLGNWVFNSVNTGIPVYVPCESVETYQMTEGWNVFSNYVCICSTGTVTVAADPVVGGEASGGGTYEGGALCTVSALPNDGYCFANWTNNGRVFSLDADYSFVVVSDHLLTAHFVLDGNIVFADANVKAICVANWDTNGDGELSYVEAASVISLGEVFRGNTEITSFEELQYFIGLTTIGNYAFYDCSGLTGSLIIPNTVTSIGNYAFYNCNGLTGSLTIPDYVTSIGNHAFYNCRSLTGSLIIPNAVTSIGNYAFCNCTGLTGSLTIPNSVTSIGSTAFFNCYSINAVLYTGNINQWCNIQFGDFLANPLFYMHNLYIDNELVTNLEIPETLTEIKDYVFCGATCLTSLTIPNSITSIGDYAFYNCSGLTGSLEIPNAVTSIGSYAFSGCYGFTGNLTIGNSVTTIGGSAFGNCRNFTSMKVLPETPPTAGDAFYSGLYGIPVYVPCGSLAAYQEADGWSNFTNYQEDCLQTQIVTLAAGTNWFSTYVDITLDDLKAALVDALPGANITIKSQNNGQTIWNGHLWVGTLRTLDLAQMYKISVASACEITLEGLPVNPAEHPLTINNGSNWIGFPLGESMTITNAFADFAAPGDIIKSDGGGQAIWNGHLWLGQLKNLESGKGYIYNSAATESRIFTFPTSAK